MAATGALHGLSPINGWCLLAARDAGAHDAVATARGVIALAAGHAAALAIAAFAFAQGLWLDAGLSRRCAAALLIATAVYRALPDAGAVRSDLSAAPAASMRIAPAWRGGHAGLALWSCLTATGQGAGLILLPTLGPMCASGDAAAPGGPLALALAMAAVHLAAMLLVVAAVATGVARGLAALSSWAGARAVRHGWTASLGIAGAILAMRG